MIKLPKISIITITFNSAATLRRTFQSVCSQSYKNIEYIVIDGASTDGTQKLIDEFKFLITKVSVEPDRGIADAFNKGLRLASGDIIGFLNSDDEFYSKNSLEKIAQNYKDQKTIICGAIELVDNNKIKVLHSKPSSLKYGMYIRHPATYIPTDLMRLNGWFDENYKIAMDYDYMVRLNNIYPSYSVIDDIIVRMYGGGASSNAGAAAVEEFKVKLNYNGLVLKDFFYFVFNYTLAMIKKYVC